MTAALGVLMLDTAFRRFPGDIGNSATFDFPVLYERVAGASVAAITALDDECMLEPFVAAAHRLIARGAKAITTSCGFLVLYQRPLQDRLPVPIATSALLQMSWLAATMPVGQQIGVLTFDADRLGPRHLAAAGAATETPVAGLPTDGHFHRALSGDPSGDSYHARETEAVGIARALIAKHPQISALVLECTNLAPHRTAIQAAVQRPIYDVITLAHWLYEGISERHWPIE
jgi:hypothetical protein